MARLRQPMISFIVPAYNEEHELSDTLAAIREAAPGAAQPYEIIVVDDASTDATPKIASDAGAKVIPIKRRQIAASRNAGARAAQGEYLFFVDADTRITRAHVSGGVAALEVVTPEAAREWQWMDLFLFGDACCCAGLRLFISA